MDPRFEEIRGQYEEREKVRELMCEFMHKADLYCTRYSRLDRFDSKVVLPNARFREDIEKAFVLFCRRSKIKPFWYEGRNYKPKNLTNINPRKHLRENSK